MKWKYVTTWLLPIAMAGGLFAVKTLTETDADKKARQDAIAAGVDKFMIGRDKTGKLAQVEALGKFFAFCKANLVPSDSGAPLSEDEKKNYCGCAMLGMQKLYYGKLSADELIEISTQPPPPDIGPDDIRRQVSAACDASLDAYR